MSPLRIKRKNDGYVEHGGFVLPQWGGVAIYSPTKKDGNKKNLVIGATEAKDSLRLFISQLRELMGVPAQQAEHITLPSPTGFSEIEFDALKLRQLHQNIQNTRSTLISLSQTLQKLHNIPINENIRNIVQESVRLLKQTIVNTRYGKFDVARVPSQMAVKKAEEAFFNPQMIAMLYFPDEHKYAVYTPFFVPVLFPILTGVWYAYKRQQTKTKTTKRRAALASRVIAN